MRRHIVVIGIGAIALGNWMGCNNGLGTGTVPEPNEVHPPASPPAEPPFATFARVNETAAQTLEQPPWHTCLNDAEGTWQPDDGRRCVPILTRNIFTGWHAKCGRNRAIFPEPDWQCCVDDGLGQCVPGSEQSDPVRPQETEPEDTDFQDWTGPKVWIYGASPQKDLELCEGDFVHVIGIRRANSEGELQGSVYLGDPELERTTLQDSRIEGSFRFAEDEDSIATYVLDQKRIGRCPDCGEKRNVVLGIDARIYAPDGSLVEGHRIGEEFVYQVRKATDELCQPE